MSWLLALIGPVSNLIGSWFGNQKEKTVLAETEVIANAQVTSTGIKTAPAVIIAEQGVNNSWISRNWRGPTCWAFTVCIIGRYLGYIGPHMPLDLEIYYISGMFAVMGAYVYARSWEKR